MPVIVLFVVAAELISKKSRTKNSNLPLDFQTVSSPVDSENTTPWESIEGMSILLPLLGNAGLHFVFVIAAELISKHVGVSL